MRGTGIRGLREAMNSQSEKDDPGLEVMEENHKRGKDEEMQ